MQGVVTMNSFILVQILGILTLIISVASLQQRKKESFLLLQVTGALLFVAQYVLTGRTTGAVIFTIVAIRGIVYFYYRKKGLAPSRTVLALFMAAVVIAAYLTWQNMLSALPMLTTIAKTWGTWQDNMKWVRRTSLIAQCGMIVYNLSASMYTGALTEVCNLTSTIIATWRYDRRKAKR